MAANPIDLVGGLATAANVTKADLTAWAKARVPQVLADITEIRNTVLIAQLVVILKSTGASYFQDTADTTTADDGVTCIVSSDAKRFKPLAAISNAMLATMPAKTIKLNATAASAAPADTAISALVDIVTPSPTLDFMLIEDHASGTLKRTTPLQAAAAAIAVAPGGRLTLTSGTPVMGSSVAGATSIIYTPAGHHQISLYNGTGWVTRNFSEVSQALSDATKSPAAAAASSLYDLFGWDDSGTFRVTRGPAWTSTTSRSAGTALVLQDGINVNNAAITNGPAALRGIYLGTIATNAAATVDFIFGALGVGGVAGLFNVWNAYNREPLSTMVRDSTDTWTYAVSSTWRAANNSATMRVTMVRGLDVDPVAARYHAMAQAGTGTNAVCGIGVDSTTAFSGVTGFNNSQVSNYVSMVGAHSGALGLGQHFVGAIEFNSSATASSWAGDLALPSALQAGLIVELCA